MQTDGKNSEFMEKLDLVKDKSKLKSVDVLFMKEIEQYNLQRALKYQRQSRKVNIFGISLFCGVIGIYAYTIHTMKQETFLDDFNEPETIIEPTATKNTAV